MRLQFFTHFYIISADRTRVKSMLPNAGLMLGQRRNIKLALGYSISVSFHFFLLLVNNLQFAQFQN